jgi:hypothetical protein
MVCEERGCSVQHRDGEDGYECKTFRFLVFLFQQKYDENEVFSQGHLNACYHSQTRAG